jgi:hypothetical protein
VRARSERALNVMEIRAGANVGERNFGGSRSREATCTLTNGVSTYQPLARLCGPFSPRERMIGYPDESRS